MDAPSTSRRAEGDWNDIDASVLYAAPKSECAIVTSNSPTAGRRVFQLRSARDETVWLTIDKVPGSRGALPESEFDPEAVSLSMRCRFGYFGDAERERVLMEHVADRLKALEGVAYRPTN